LRRSADEPLLIENARLGEAASVRAQQRARVDADPFAPRLAQQVDGAVPFTAELWRIGKDKPHLKTQADVQRIVDDLAPGGDLKATLWWVESSETLRKNRRPDPPFTTSTMQQAAARSLRFPPGLTMKLAQQLYEGVPLGEAGTVGLITYMRTDSTAVAPEAQTAAREVVERFWGAGYLPARPPVYHTKVKSAQEAHEAIRPTDPQRTPKAVRPFLDDKLAALYELIWRRFIASQMADALYDVTTALIPTARGDRRESRPEGVPECERSESRSASGAGGVDERANRLPYLFRAVGRLLVFDGFLRVYEEGRDPGEETEDGGPLPPLHPGEPLDLLELIPKQHWTQPPPRYTEASLIKELEKRGIGRPSTFAGMVDLIQDRGYVVKEQRFLKPAPLGFAVCDLLVGFFPDLFDYGFTAQMEDTLDGIASGRAERLATLEAFWAGLEPALRKAGAEMPKVQVETPPPTAGQAGKTGKAKVKAATPTGKTCPQCGGVLVQRKGKYGAFVGCSNYPTCRYIEKRTDKQKATDESK